MGRINRVKTVLGRIISGVILLSVPGYCQTQVGNWMSTDASVVNTIDFACAGSQTVRIYVCAPNIARVSFDTRTTNKFTSTRDVLSMADINRSWPAVSYTVDSTSDAAAVSIITSAMRIRVQKSPFRLTYYDSTGAQITGEDAARGMTVNSDSASPAVQFIQGADEHYFGWGLSYSWYREYQNIDNKGQSYSRKRSEAYYMYSTAGYGLFLLFAEPRPTSTSWADIANGVPAAGFNCTGNYVRYWQSPSTQYGFGPMEYLSYFFIAGNWRTAIDGYTQISGRPALIGKKWLGIHRDFYIYNIDYVQMQRWATKIRAKRYPMDVVRFDHFFDWGNFGYLPSVANPAAWNPNVPAVVRYYRNNGFYVGGMMNGIGFAGCCNGSSIAPVDDSAHATVAVNNGFDFAWYDAMNYHSRQNAFNTWETWKKAHKGDETKTWVSKGWMSLSSQSWPASHTGDKLNCLTDVSGTVGRGWVVFPASLMHHLVGYAVNYTDLGEGYDWNYIGLAMRPLIAYHMAGAAGTNLTCGDKFQECVAVVDDDAAYPSTSPIMNVMRKWSQFHYRFIPYFFTYAMIAHETGMPVWRGMMCQNGGEKDAATYTLNMQCYVGEEIIISPYYPDNPVDNNGGARRNIYLPRGVWYDYFTGTKYTGPTTITSYPCDPGGGIINKKLPMFVKANAIIPLMDTLLYIGEKPESLMTIQVWPTTGADGTETGAFTLYEDEGIWDSVARTRGPAAKIALTSSCVTAAGVQTTVVHLGAFSGSRYCANPAIRRYRIELHKVNQVKYAKSSGVELSLLSSIAEYNAGTAGFYWDAAGSVCFINASGNAAEGFDVIASTDTIIASVRTPFSNHMREKVSILRSARSVRISVPWKGNHVVEILNTQGRLITRRSGSSAASYMISMAGRAPMAYVIRVAADGRTPVIKRMVF